MPFVQLHTHTEFSVLDGLSTCAEAVTHAAADGNPAIAITDHGTCAGHPQFQADCERAGLNPIFGIEAYFRPDRLERPAPGDKEAQSRLINGNHIVLLAQGDEGLRHLWAASTEASFTGFYGRPRMDWAILEEHGADLIATTSCLNGILSPRLLAGEYGAALRDLDRLRAIFGDRLYLEIQPGSQPDQIRLNRILAEISASTGVPLAAAADGHYPSEAEAALHRVWMAGRGADDYWSIPPMGTEASLRAGLAYLDADVVDRAVRVTADIAERCTARIGGHAEPPVFTPGGTHDDDARRLRALCEANWSRVPGTDPYRARMEREFEVVAGKQLAGCYLIVEEIVRWCLDRGILVGPGRGSAAGSLMSYLLGITSVDPLRAGLMFERFLTPGRASLPDFDLDFPSSKRAEIQQHVIDVYGEESVVRVGTILRYQAKGVLNRVFGALARELPDQAAEDARFINSAIEDAESHTAGLGLSWDEAMQLPEVAERAPRYPSVFEQARVFYDRIYASGQHPAGLIISPGKSLAGMMPMRMTTKSRLPVSEWDYRAADSLNMLKLDLLTLRTLDSVQEAIELVAERTGRRLDPRNWDAEHEDPMVWDAIDSGETLGMFQIETSLCRAYAVRHRPRNLNDLADLTTYVRPGPRNSGATEAYLRLASGQEPVTFPHPLLADHLSRSRGVMLYQEDILTAVRVLAGYDDLEADGVRKILGKKLTDKISSAGEEFVRRASERGHDPEQMRGLWEQIAEFGKYAFNRAHGYSYAVLSYWTAWLKVHYPLETLTALLSTLGDMSRMADFAMEARRLGIAVLPPDVRFCGAGFSMGGLSIRYGLSAIPGVGPAAIAPIVAAQPYRVVPSQPRETLEDFRERSGVNAGVLLALARAGAMDPLVPSRRGLIRMIEAERDGTSSRCVHKDEEASGPNGLPCRFDWDSEPQPAPRLGKKGKPLKVIPQPPPKRCTTACRRYQPPSVPDLNLPEYPPAALYRLDDEIFGCWMSDAPFSQLDLISPGLRARSAWMASAVRAAGPGTYPVAALWGGAHQAITRAGNAMWWATLITEPAVFEVAVFSPRSMDEPDLPSQITGLTRGTLLYAEVVKSTYEVPGRGPRTSWRLAGIQPVRIGGAGE